jgi:hypothetical protein
VLIFQAFKEERARMELKGTTVQIHTEMYTDKKQAAHFTQRKEILSGAAEKAAIAP